MAIALLPGTPPGLTKRRNLRAFLFAATFSLSPLAIGQNLIANGSFETVAPALPANSYCGTPSCTAADWSGSYQIGNGAASPWDIPQPDPNGVNALILQKQASASQSITLAFAGTYDLAFYIANRSLSGYSGPQTVTVSLDGVLIKGGTFGDLPYTWTQESLSFSASAGAHTLTFTGLGDNGGDVTAFVDEVSLQRIDIPTTTTLKVAPSTAPQGTPISLTALVAAANATPSGTVTFGSGTKTLGKSTLNATGQATLTTTALPLGIDPLVAVYSGSSTFSASTSATVNVTISSGPLASVTPSSLAFPATLVGTVSAAQPVTLTNTGSSPLSIKSIMVTGTSANAFIDISGCGTSLAVGKSCTIYVGFAPQKSGSATAALSVADNAPESPQKVTLTGTGVAAHPLTLTPASLAFPATTVGGASTGKTVTLTNSGTAAVSITSIVLNGVDPHDFVTLNNCGAVLGGGASCTVFVAFTPTAIGSRTATLSVVDDASGSPQSVTLSGTGN
jgi:hypothetical protein